MKEPLNDIIKWQSQKSETLTLRDGQQSSFATRIGFRSRSTAAYPSTRTRISMRWRYGAAPSPRLDAVSERKPRGRASKPSTRQWAMSRNSRPSRAAATCSATRPIPTRSSDGFCNAIQSGLGIMRIFDALNDVDNVKSTIKYVKQYGGIADCAVCYTVDPKYPEPGFFARLTRANRPQTGLHRRLFPRQGPPDGRTGRRHDHRQGHVGPDSPRRVSGLVRLLKRTSTYPSFPYPLHAGLRTGFGLSAILAGSTSSTPTAGTSPKAGRPAIELIHVFCKLGINCRPTWEGRGENQRPAAGHPPRTGTSRFSVSEKPAPKGLRPR